METFPLRARDAAVRRDGPRKRGTERIRIKQTIDRPFSRLSHGYLGSAFELFMPDELSLNGEIFLSRRTSPHVPSSREPCKGTMIETELLC